MRIKIFLFLTLTAGLCFGQSGLLTYEKPNSLKPQNENGISVSGDISSSLECIGDVLTSPFSWERDDFILAGGVITGVAGSFLLDDQIRKLVLKNKSEFNKNVLERAGHLYSTVLYVGPASLVFYFSGVAFENLWIRKTGQMLIEAVVITGIAQIPISIISGRARPFFNEGNNSFKLFAGTDDNRASFFSGHSMIAFSFSTILSGQINNIWASIGLYSLAVLGPFSRMYKDKHWFSDSVLGSVSGYFAGQSILNWHKKNDNMEEADINIIPFPAGIFFTWKF